jgi:uncharacterized protein with PIN domain
MSIKKCLDCGYAITWAEQRRQFARAIKIYGLTPEEAGRVMPRCQVCTTNLLSPRRQKQRDAEERRHRPGAPI